MVYFTQIDIDNWRITSPKGEVLGWIHEEVEERIYRLTWKIPPPRGVVLSTGMPVKCKGTRTYRVEGTLTQVQDRVLRSRVGR